MAAERLAAEHDRYFRLGPAPLAPRAERRLASQDPDALATALRGWRSHPPKVFSLAHGSALPARRAVPRALPRAPPAPASSTSTPRSRGSRASSRRSRSSRCSSSARRRGRARAGRAVCPDPGFPSPTTKGFRMERPLRLISAIAARRRARAHGRGAPRRRVAAAHRRGARRRGRGRRASGSRPRSACSRERYREGRSGIVLEPVAGGYAFRAAREAAEACARLFERPVERGLSQAALETLAIVAYLGPSRAPRSPGSAASPRTRPSPSLVERGLIAEAGRESGPGGAVRTARRRSSSGSSGSRPRGAAAARRPRRRRRGDPRAPAAVAEARAS